jgi:hypothetical protein
MSEYPYGISADLNTEERARLEATPVSLGHGRSRTLADLVVGWAAHVTRLLAERDLPIQERRDAWNAHDYVAALIIRGMLERGLALVDGELRQKVAQVVSKFDEQLRSFTEPDEQGVLRRFASDEAGNQWWWERIPRTGPIRDDLNALPPPPPPSPDM